MTSNRGPNGKAVPAHADVSVAVIGGGIVGLMTALGLLGRGYSVTVYERAPALHEFGAAFAFTGVAREAMRQLDARVLAALSRVGEANRHPYNRYWDGFSPKTKDQAAAEAESLLFRTSARELDYWGCLRQALLQELAAEVPAGVVQFSKQLADCVDEPGADKVLLRFADGTTAKADAVIGCDGIHSRTRQLVLGDDDPASRAHYSHKVVYRALLPIAQGIAALGEDKANNQCTHLGPDAHLVSFPVANWTLLNVFVFLHDPSPWPDRSRMTMPAARDELESALTGWGPAVRELVASFPRELVKWGIFDTADHLARTYARGRICIAGDAAHAATPFHGAGAGMGVEDALVLVTALDTALTLDRTNDGTHVIKKAEAVAAAFKAYSEVRRPRTEWLVQSSRDMGDIYEWRYSATGSDPQKCKAEFERRSRKLWDFDIDKIVAEARSETEQWLRTESNKQSQGVDEI